jgi:hypothetical protein
VQKLSELSQIGLRQLDSPCFTALRKVFFSREFLENLLKKGCHKNTRLPEFFIGLCTLFLPALSQITAEPCCVFVAPFGCPHRANSNQHKFLIINELFLSILFRQAICLLHNESDDIY